MTRPPERVVHAVSPAGTELVRYDRAGQWYVEEPTGESFHVQLDGAIAFVVALGTIWYPERPGGGRLRREVWKHAEADGD